MNKIKRISLIILTGFSILAYSLFLLAAVYETAIFPFNFVSGELMEASKPISVGIYDQSGNYEVRCQIVPGQVFKIDDAWMQLLTWPHKSVSSSTCTGVANIGPFDFKEWHGDPLPTQPAQ
jgi:hypothetical protein